MSAHSKVFWMVFLGPPAIDWDWVLFPYVVISILATVPLGHKPDTTSRGDPVELTDGKRNKVLQTSSYFLDCFERMISRNTLSFCDFNTASFLLTKRPFHPVCPSHACSLTLYFRTRRVVVSRGVYCSIFRLPICTSNTLLNRHRQVDRKGIHMLLVAKNLQWFGKKTSNHL